MADKDLAVKQGEQLPAELQQGMMETGVDGFEGVGFDSFANQYLRIAQPTSPQLLEDSDDYIDGIKPGFFFNDLTKKVYGKTVKLIVFKYERMFLEWADENGGLRGQYTQDEVIQLTGKTNFFNLRNPETQNEIDETHNYFCLVTSDMNAGPIILSLSSSGIKHSKKWMSTASMIKIKNADGSLKRAPLYASVYEIETLMNKNDQGQWYMIGNKSTTNVKKVGWINEEQWAHVKNAIEIMNTVKVDYGKSKEGSSDGTVNEDEVPY